jgi:Cu(I)/Ag(I) efflux system periplasmic protein CusF
MKNTFLLLALVLATALGAQARGQAVDHSGHHAPAAAAPVQSDGEVRKVDLAQGKVTLRHGPLPNLDMPAMTMVFKAADPKLLEGLKAGDKVRFTADKVNGALTVTALQVVE